MTEIIAGVEIPATAAATEATRRATELTSPLLMQHSHRVFLFGSLHARRLGLGVDAELLYVAAMFHDAGLLAPFGVVEQRFEVDGADHAHRFLLERGFTPQSAELVWTAIALHTTPGIPGRMGPEVAMTNLGVLTDVVGVGLDLLPGKAVDEVVEAHPRGRFKQGFLATSFEGLRHRPDTTYGTVNADILQRFDPHFRRTSMVDHVMSSPWPT